MWRYAFIYHDYISKSGIAGSYSAGSLIPQQSPILATLWTIACQALLSMGFSIPKYCAGFHFLLQGIFSTQGSKPHISCISCSGRHILSFQHHSMVTLIFSNLRNFQTVCQSDSIVLHPQQQVIEGSDFSTFWPIVISIYHFILFQHPSRCAVVPHCDFDLYLRNDQRC